MGWLPIYIAASAQHEEEQILAQYRARDLAGRYEHKLLYGRWGAFRDAARLQATLAEEAEAEWELVEKLDDERLVLRRLRTARQADGARGRGVVPDRRYAGKQRGAQLAALVALVAVVGIPLTLVAPVLGGALVVAAMIVGLVVALRK